MPKLSELVQLIEKNTAARKALATLVEEGCNQERLIELFYDCFRGASPEESEKTIETASAAVARWNRLSEDLRDSADRVDGALTDLAKMGVLKAAYREGHHPSEAMRDFAEMLRKACATLKPLVNRKSGGNYAFYYLCAVVRAATRNASSDTNYDEHYKEIAAIQSAFKGQTYITDRQLLKDADAVRNRFARYERKAKQQTQRLELKGQANENKLEVESQEQANLKEECNVNLLIAPQDLLAEAEDEVAEWPEFKKKLLKK